MTTEEFLNNLESEYIITEVFEGIYYLHEVVLKALEDFARIKCKEQRELCYENGEVEFTDREWVRSWRVDRESIINAPEPEL